MAEDPAIYIVQSTFADLMDHPENGVKIGRRDSQILYGESFSVSEKHGEWFYGISLSDNYKGFVHQSHLMSPPPATSVMQVKNLFSHLYTQPNFKTRPLAAISFLSYVRLNGDDPVDGFVQTVDKKWIFAEHLQHAPVPNPCGPDVEKILDTGLRFLGVPYLYGGRTSFGIDCSGLVQLCLMQEGLQCPRDTDQQMNIGKPVSPEKARKGDIVFFKGHVGIMIDEKSILNANARTMDVRVEMLADLAAVYKGITAVHRLI